MSRSRSNRQPVKKKQEQVSAPTVTEPVSDTKPDTAVPTVEEPIETEQKADTESVLSEEVTGDQSESDDQAEEVDVDDAAESETEETDDVNTVAEVDPITALIEVSEDDEDVVKTLKTLLQEFDNANSVVGKEPAEFAKSASLALSVTRHLIRFPKVPLLDLFLDYTKAKIEGGNQSSFFLKGSTTLKMGDEKLVSVLFTLFHDMALGATIPITSGAVIAVLQKPEFINYYNRKIAATRK